MGSSVHPLCRTDGGSRSRKLEPPLADSFARLLVMPGRDEGGGQNFFFSFASTQRSGKEVVPSTTSSHRKEFGSSLARRGRVAFWQAIEATVTSLNGWPGWLATYLPRYLPRTNPPTLFSSQR